MENGREKQRKIYWESAAVVLAAVVDDGAVIVVDGGAGVVATVWADGAVDVFVPSCDLGLNFNLSLNFNGEGIFRYNLCEKSRYLGPFSQESTKYWRGWTAGYNCQALVLVRPINQNLGVSANQKFLPHPADWTWSWG